jgi:hypothetical protein
MSKRAVASLSIAVSIALSSFGLADPHQRRDDPPFYRVTKTLVLYDLVDRNGAVCGVRICPGSYFDLDGYSEVNYDNYETVLPKAAEIDELFDTAGIAEEVGELVGSSFLRVVSAGGRSYGSLYYSNAFLEVSYRESRTDHVDFVRSVEVSFFREIVLNIDTCKVVTLTEPESIAMELTQDGRAYVTPFREGGCEALHDDETILVAGPLNASFPHP